MERDLRRRNKYEKQQQRFKHHEPRTMKDRTGPRSAPAENRSGRISKRDRVVMAQETIEFEDDESIKGTITYLIKELVKLEVKLEKNKHDTEFEVELETTLDGAFRLVAEQEEEGIRIGVLNFASAKNPGGGFLKGSMAQEESLALFTGLYNCIKDSPMYQLNRDNPRRGLYHHGLIYSPNVTVLRDSEGQLLEEKDRFGIDILTVPAVNWGDALKKGVFPNEIKKNVVERMDYLLSVAVDQGIEILILGSWGCGVFGGNINFVAREFISFLTGKYEGVFRGICFSTLDPKHQQVFERELNNAFG